MSSTAGFCPAWAYKPDSPTLAAFPCGRKTNPITKRAALRLPVSFDDCYGISAQRGGTAWAGQHAGGRHLVTTGRTIEPIFAKLALRLGKALLLLALGTLPIHFAGFHILLEQQPAARADFHPLLAEFRAAPRRRAKKYRLARLAPVLAFLFFLAYRTLFHKTSLLPFPGNNKRGNA